MIRVTISTMPPSANGHSDIDLVDAYIEHGSVWKAAQAMGMCGQTVHRRLAKIGAIKPKRILTDDERARIIAYYTETPPEVFSLDNLADEMGRSRQFISRKAGDLGLTNPRRPLTAIQLASVSRPKWADKQHPRGALGMKHTDETKEIVSASSKIAWAKQKANSTGRMSPESRQQFSDMATARAALQVGENAYSRARGGRRADVGDMYFRSAWEANYARYLNWLQSRGEIERWEYEPETFWFLSIKRGVRSYKPDFRIWEKGKSHFVEVKGWMDARSKTKLKRMAKYYPAIRVDVVSAKQYAQIKTAVSRIIPGWES